jgi:hypothetical protein
LRTAYTKKLPSTSVVTEGWIIGGAAPLLRFYLWYGSVKQEASHRLIEITTRDATANYPSNELADRKQDRMVFWKNGFTPKQRNAPISLILGAWKPRWIMASDSRRIAAGIRAMMATYHMEDLS